MSKKVIFTADIHRGVPGRDGDINYACRVVREYAKAANIDVIVVLGDLFHNRENLAINVLQQAVDFHEEAAQKYDQKWVTFPGNHDMFLRHSWRINSVAPMRKYLTYIDDVKLLTLEDKRFWILPFITFEKSYMKVLRRLEDQYEEGDVLLTHIGVRGASLNTCFLLKDWSIVNFEYSKFRKIYTGHFHSRQQLGDGVEQPAVFYPGSLIPFKFDEGDIAHGFYVYDLDTGTHKFVNLWKAGEKFFPGEKAPPQFHTFLDENLNDKTAAECKGNIIRVALQRQYTQEEKRKAKDWLMELGAASVRWWDMTQRLDKKPGEVTAQPHRNLFKAWLDVDKKGVQGLDPAILDKAHDDVVHEGDELYAVEESEV
jgi:DNA repair exonuclease SbcCD nuclease subunit